MGMQELFQEKDYCLKEIGKAREIWGRSSTTIEEMEGTERALGFMLLYCPDEIKDLVWSQLNECGKRILYMKIMKETD